MSEPPAADAGYSSLLKPLTDSSWAWLLVGGLIYLSFGFTEMMGSDLWWHLAAGREIMQTGTLWLVDDWSYTELGSPWRNHEWLADLVFFSWASLWGLASLVYWKWVLIVGSFCCLQTALARVSGSHAAALLASAAAVMLAAPFLDMRPQLYTLLGVSVLLCLSWQREARLRELLPLFLLWVNLHGGFIFGLMLLAVLRFPFKALSLASLRAWLVTLLACSGVCLLNPDGMRVFWLPLVYALDSSSPYRSLAEWRSPFESGGIRSPLYEYSLVLAAALTLSWVLPVVRRALGFFPEVLMIAMLTAAMSATSRRFIILWAFACAMLLAPFLAAIFRQHALRLLTPVVLLAAFAVGLIRLAPYPLRADVAYHYLTAEYAYPHAIADFIELNALEGKTFAYYNWGGYLHWRTDGALKVFLDGRANTLFDDQTYLDYVSVLHARAGWLELIENSGAEFFLWPRTRGGTRLINGLLDTRRWHLVYEDARGILLAKMQKEALGDYQVPKDSAHAALAAALKSYRAGDYPSAALAIDYAHTRRPWDKEVCTWRQRILQVLGSADEARAAVSACRAWFPSKYL